MPYISRCRPTFSRLIKEDGSEMLDTAAAAAADDAGGTWTDSDNDKPGWSITGRQDHPHRLSDGVHGQRRSHQFSDRRSSQRRPSPRL